MCFFALLILDYIRKEFDTNQKRSNSDFDVRCATNKFYGNSHNSKFDMLSYLGITFKVNQSSGRHLNTGQQRLYKFCYLHPFDLWTSYSARILFLKGCGTLF